jgi:hypothetical protein
MTWTSPIPGLGSLSPGRAETSRVHGNFCTAGLSHFRVFHQRHQFVTRWSARKVCTPPVSQEGAYARLNDS